MALKPCPECKNEISTKAKSCPHCGYDIKAAEAAETASCMGAGCLVLLFGMIGLVVLAVVAGSGTPSEPSSRQTVRQHPRLNVPTLSQREQYENVVYARRIDNIRSGPSTSFPVLRKTSELERIQFEKKEGQWYNLVEFGRSSAGWVHESVVYDRAEGERLLAARQDYLVLRGPWKPHNLPNGLGLEILVDHEIAREELRALLKRISGNHKPALISVWSDRKAFEDALNDIYGENFRKHMILSYSHTDKTPHEITWVQSIGKFSELAWSKEDL